MTMKRLIVISLIWLVLLIGVGLFGVAYIRSHPVRGTTRSKRIEKLGKGFGVLGGIGLGVIWLPYAAKVGKKRRAEREKRLKK